MPEQNFIEYVEQFQRQERANVQLDSHNRLMTPELELVIRKMIREEMNKYMDEITRRMHGGRALEVK